MSKNVISLFILNYQIQNNKFDSIRPGKTDGDLTVTQMKAIHYNRNGTIDFKINFDNEYSDLAAVQKRKKKETILNLILFIVNFIRNP
ncbi:Uncharacterized protein FWK35_00012162 [Aphis craccivora]|uniref:Uncharacterized protein n=1 Tax=Aphis craccivora TaxID=307492 RepID=A0A6G0YJ91_APHCR|nr:Uncharacterized protein FWK35_00012162 [Aphis craccivora]